MSINTRVPSPVSRKELFSGNVANKALFHKLLLLGVSFCLFCNPVVANASTIPFLSNLLNKTATISSARSSSFNSQTMSALSPAVNIDPKGSVGGGDITVVADSALLPQEGPAGTAADILNQPSTSQISVYVVREGDTLSEIAKMFDVSVNTIVWANDIQGGVVRPGETLIILPVTGLQHTVVKGDTLASLAKKYNADAHEIAQFNDLSDTATLTVGSTVLVPNAELSTSSKNLASSGAKTVKSKTVTAKKTTKTSFQPARLRGVGGPDEGSYYGWPVAGGLITQKLHGFNGVDIGAPKGTDIYAAAAGTVLIARSSGWNGGYGSYVVIGHPNGTQTLYAHASKVLVSAGEEISQGERIALVGSTGESTGSHLHFEIRGAKNPFGELSVGSAN